MHILLESIPTYDNIIKSKRLDEYYRKNNNQNNNQNNIKIYKNYIDTQQKQKKQTQKPKPKNNDRVIIFENINLNFEQYIENLDDAFNRLDVINAKHKIFQWLEELNLFEEIKLMSLY